MHQDIIDALNLAQRRRHYAAGGFGSPNAMTVGQSPEELNRQYLDYLYQNELGRKADEGGRNYWLQQLNNGMSMDQVQQAFDQSQEGQTYNQRPPRFSNDPRNPHTGGGLPGFPGLLPDGTTPDVMNPRYDPYYGNQPLDDMGGTGTKAGGQGIGGQGPMPQRTPLEEIDLMYRSQLGREADEGGRNYWLQQLQGGMPLDQIQQIFSNTPEGQEYQRQLGYTTFIPNMQPSYGGGTGTKAGGGGQPSFPLQNPGYPQNPNAPMPNMPQGNPGYPGGGNGTKAGGGYGGMF